MRIILKLPMEDPNRGRFSLHVYDITAFDYYPRVTDPYIRFYMMNREQVDLTWQGRDTEGMLGRIVETLLGSAGEADLRIMEGDWDNIDVDFLGVSPVQIEHESDEPIEVYVTNNTVPVMVANEPIKVIKMF